MAEYTYLTPLLHFPEAEKLAAAALLGGTLALGGAVLNRRLSTSQGVQENLVPSERLTAFGVLDFFVEAFVKFHDSIVGVENRRHVPFTGSIFLFILTANLLGLVPGVPAITTTVWVNVGMALVVFVYFNFQGIKAHGLWGYLKHFMGPVWWLVPLLFPVEILSTSLRVLTLNLRLYWNISADHTVLGIFTSDLLWPGLSAPVYFLGLFVAFMQAFIFTVLTMVYILMASEHSEEEGHH